MTLIPLRERCAAMNSTLHHPRLRHVEKLQIWEVSECSHGGTKTSINEERSTYPGIESIALFRSAKIDEDSLLKRWSDDAADEHELRVTTVAASVEADRLTNLLRSV
mmetsp:Transcript_104304/g.185432  ORF Transcript_104304/g.185432 Transcript_104304/m.185432 type:complete len:107 (-) Transcript_104304:827-1147(-)